MYSEIEKLGIAVVYLVSERNEKMLDLHLSQIEKNTEVPYTIYGNTNRLLPQFHHKLEQNANVKICDCKPFDVSRWANRDIVAKQGRYEHSFYLEQLIRIAIEDGVSHVAIFHVDSFPIQRGWAKKLVGKLSDRCVLAGIMRDEKIDQKPLTACIFYHKDFYLKYTPRLLPTEEEISLPSYKCYLAKFPHYDDSGSGYGFKIFMEGLSWYPLLRSNNGRDHPFIAGVYDDLVFHLAAAAFKDSTKWVGFVNKEVPISYLRSVTRKVMDALFGERIRRKITDRIPLEIRHPDKYQVTLAWELERHKLLEDPETYLANLR